jgi:hypothetical protein
MAPTSEGRREKRPENVKQLLQLRVTRKESLSSNHISALKSYEHHSRVKVLKYKCEKSFNYIISLN